MRCGRPASAVPMLSARVRLLACPRLLISGSRLLCMGVGSREIMWLRTLGALTVLWWLGAAPPVGGGPGGGTGTGMGGLGPQPDEAAAALSTKPRSGGTPRGRSWPGRCPLLGAASMSV